MGIRVGNLNASKLNAPHHVEIATFPHHKHEVDDIKESLEPSLEEVLLEIAEKQRNIKP
ncbi:MULTISPECIES: toxin-antitoxin system TumE family protein [Microcystis]|uniref:toxin-antitoxin system TumE family protein n=1 Tax=Microcystis TaxID=1125 RepID=UPI00350EB842